MERKDLSVKNKAKSSFGFLSPTFQFKVPCEEDGRFPDLASEYLTLLSLETSIRTGRLATLLVTGSKMVYCLHSARRQPKAAQLDSSNFMNRLEVAQSYRWVVALMTLELLSSTATVAAAKNQNHGSHFIHAHSDFRRYVSNSVSSFKMVETCTTVNQRTSVK